MKKTTLTLLTSLILSITAIHAQTISEGAIIGVHLQELKLDPDVTMNQVKKFYLEKYIPISEKAFPGMSIKLAEGSRGEHSNRFAIFYIFDSAKERDIYFKENGDFTEAGLAALKKTEAVAAEMAKLAKTTYTYTDWKIL